MRGPLSILTRDRADGVDTSPRTLRIPPPWVMLLAITPFLTASYLLLPTGAARVVTYPAFGLIGMGAVLAVVRWQRPARIGSWRLIALALALLSAGDITYSVLAIGGEVSYPSLSDVAYLVGYVALILGVVGLFRGRVVGGDRTAFIDAAILSAGPARCSGSPSSARASRAALTPSPASSR